MYQVTKQLAQFTSIEVALSVGGLDIKMQESMLRRNPDIVIATPGRLIDHVKNTPSFGLESIEVGPTPGLMKGGLKSCLCSRFSYWTRQTGCWMSASWSR